MQESGEKKFINLVMVHELLDVTGGIWKALIGHQVDLASVKGKYG